MKKPAARTRALGKVKMPGQPMGGGGGGVVVRAKTHGKPPAKVPKLPGRPLGAGGGGVAKRAKTHAKARKWSPDESVALCSARAVAESLRIASGLRLSDDDVVGLYWSVASDGDAGISILDALKVCEESREYRALPYARLDLDHALAMLERGAIGVERDGLPGLVLADDDFRLAHALILGLDLPYGEPHAVAVDPDGMWWSWGEPYDPWPGAVVEEAWAVQWRP